MRRWSTPRRRNALRCTPYANANPTSNRVNSPLADLDQRFAARRICARCCGAGLRAGSGVISMACIDVDQLTQYEADAKRGRADALYNLGLAYSTGQGVRVDFVAAHKWFNLAAVRGVEEAKSWRAQISREMDAAQIAEAQRLAREWLSRCRPN